MASTSNRQGERDEADPDVSWGGVAVVVAVADRLRSDLQ